MTIGKLQLDVPLFLAPMAGYTDRAMRQICRSFGAAFSVSEMVSAKALVFRDRKSAVLARLSDADLPAAVQIFGSDPAVMAEGAAIVAGGCGGPVPSAIDLNFGCPVKKIVSNGEGSALMKTPERIFEIVSAVTKAVDLPITVKIRAGWDAAHRNAAECARAAEAGGCAAVFVHGRTRSQFYSGEVDLSAIREVKAAVSVPVVGNGDIRSASDALRMMEETGCDGIMVGRAAVGNPFLFREIVAALHGKTCPIATPEERCATALLQLKAAVADKGEAIAVTESRKQVGAYVSGIRGAAAYRLRINNAATVSEIEAILSEVLPGSAGA